MSATIRIRRCGICSSTDHIRTKCDYKARMRKAAADAKIATATAERDTFVAKPAEDKILTLYDMMLALRKDLQELATRLDHEMDRRPVSPEGW
jgi:hypothetical protein